MEKTKIDILRHFYITSYAELKEKRKNLKFDLLRDYTDPLVIKRIQDATVNLPMFDGPLIFCEAKNSYIITLADLLSNIGDDDIQGFFVNAHNNTVLTYVDDLLFGESKAKIIRTGDKLIYQVCLPNREKTSNLSYAVITHELSHYTLTNDDRPKEAFEYSEALPMYFEYLTYNEACDNGYHFFINNRLASLNDDYKDLKDDLEFAGKPSILGIDPNYYQEYLAKGNCYLESLEYALNLIDRASEDKKAVYESIRKILLGESTCLEEGKVLDIDTSRYDKLQKILKI